MTQQRILNFAAIAEIATGVALIVNPMLVVKLLFGVYAPWTSLSIGRVAGVAMVSLGIACWPARGADRPPAAAWRGMLAYNGLVAAYLAYLALVGKIGGAMLWPAVGLHVVIAAALVGTRSGTAAAGSSPRGQ